MVMRGTDMKIAETPADDLDEYATGDGYARWQQREGVRVIVDFAFEDLGAIELGPWERKGGSGVIINIPNDHLTNDAHVVEIRPGGKSEPEHHVYEEFCYIISGRGATNIWIDDDHKQTFEWHAGSLFAIPLNAWYQHFNGSGEEPARYISVTTAPPMMRLFNDLDFVFDTDSYFKGRFDAQNDYFSGSGKLYKKRVWQSNFIPNAPDMPLYGWRDRGAGGINVMLEMAENSSKAHISEFPVGTYKKAHRHGPGAHLLILSGDAGYSTLWTKDDRSDLRKADWKVGGMVIVPGDEMFHQHFNTGNTRARYLAMYTGGMGLYKPRSNRGWLADKSVKEGGWQIEYEDEERKNHEAFEAELAVHGAPCRMKAFVPWCTGEVGPTSEREA
ncbi:MAG: cupin domain-containing protein [Chloroflexi bacterium]|nr:cupin domain-containing protein [Chloroflexota bacterium]